MPLNFNKYYYLPLSLSLSLSLASVISAVIQNMADDVVLQEAITNEIFQAQRAKLRRDDSPDIESHGFPGPHHGHHSKVNFHIPHHTSIIFPSLLTTNINIHNYQFF